MLKTNSTQICLPNGSLEEFSKYIYRKPVDRELWRRNVLGTVIFTEWRPGTSRMTELTQTYVPNDGQEFWGPENSRNEYRERTAGRRRGNTNIFTGWRQEFWRQNAMKRTTEHNFIHGIKTTCCTCEFFTKLKLHSPKRLVRISAFWKTHSRKLIPN